MSRPKPRRKEAAVPTAFDQARDEMFQHIIRCGVLQATQEHQNEWFDDTLGYLGERYELNDGKVEELRTLGERFVQPPKRTTAVAGAASAA